MRCRRISSIAAAVVILFYLLGQQARAEVEAPRADKSPAAAVGISLVATLAPVLLGVPLLVSDSPGSDWQEGVGLTLVSAGIVVGPGVGHLYAHNGAAFRRGSVIRGLSYGLLLTGTYLDSESDDESTAATIMIGAGAVVTLAAVIIDIAQGPRSVHRYNSEIQSPKQSLQPQIRLGPGGAGVGLALRF